MTCYKLLDKEMRSHGELQWVLGKWHKATEVGRFCGPGGFHAYEHPLLAVLHNSIHASIPTPRLFRAEMGGEIIRDGQMKLKAQRMRIVEEIPVPVITPEQRAAYAILCARALCTDARWTAWADSWLSGADRSTESARSARSEAEAAEEVATLARLAAEALGLGGASGWSMEAASWAARSASASALAAAGQLDLISLAQQAMQIAGGSWYRETHDGADDDTD